VQGTGCGVPTGAPNDSLTVKEGKFWPRMTGLRSPSPLPRLVQNSKIVFYFREFS
jgi:hypothetical protein